MFKRLALVATIAVGICACMSSPLMAQSKEEGLKLAVEAERLQAQARTDGDLKKASQKYEQALRIFEKSKFDKGIGVVSLNLGIIYRGWGQYDKAMECYEKSLEIAKKMGDLHGQAQALGNIGNVYCDRGQDSNAVEFHEKSLAIFRKLRDIKGERLALINLGVTYRDSGQYATAVEFFEKSLEICRKLGDANGERQSLLDLGRVYDHWGRYSKAVEFYDRSLAISRKAGDLKGEAHALGNLGGVYLYWGKYQKAADHFSKSLEISRKLGDLKGEAYALGNLGNVLYSGGNYPIALDFYEKSLVLFTKMGDTKGEAYALNNIGNVYQGWGRCSKAAEYFEKALETVRMQGDLQGEGKTLSALGAAYAFLGQYSKALPVFERSLAIRRKLGNPLDEGNVLMSLGELCAQRGDFKTALRHFETGMAIHQQMGVPVGWSNKLIGNLYLDMGDPSAAAPFLIESASKSSLGRLTLLMRDCEAAKVMYESLLEDAEESRKADDLFTAYTGLGAVYECMGEDVRAAEYYLKAVDFTEEMRSGLGRSEREQFFHVRVAGFLRTASYKGLARVLVRMNRPVEAMKRSEYTKARVFAEGLSRWSEGKGLDVPADLLKTDSELSDQLAALKKARQKGYERGNQEIIAALDPQVKDLEAKFSAHVAKLRANYPLFAATKYPEPVDLSQTALKENEWALEYDVTDSGIIIYLAKGKMIVKSLFKPVPKKEVDSLVEKFRQTVVLAEGESVRKKVKQFDFGTGKKLSDLLLGDVLSALPKDVPLIVVPDGQLGIIPFEMLVLNHDGGMTTDTAGPHVTGAEFFGDRNPISYYQSITALTLARTLGTQQKPGERLLALMDPVFSPDDPRMAKCDRERRKKILDAAPTELVMAMRTENQLHFPRLELTSKLGESLKTADPQRTDLYQGMEAQKSILLEKDLSRYSFIVFGTHGYFGNALAGIQEPVLSLTLVGQPDGKDGFLRMSEVMKMKINCDIVALTACQSGLGHQISGEGTMGMGRAFQHAGAKSVLMSLWSVAEKSSVMLETFFRHIKEGKSKLEALRLARKEIRDAGHDHPFFWAPFILVGETGDVSTSDIQARLPRSPVWGSGAQPYREQEENSRRQMAYTIAFDVADRTVSVKVSRDNETVATRKISWGKEELENRVWRFLFPFRKFESFKESLRAFDPDAGKALCTELLSEVLEQVPRGAHVKIHPSQILAELPFEALVVEGTPRWEETGGISRTGGLTFLADLYEISYARPEGSLQTRSACQVPLDGTGRILVMADPVFSADDQRSKASEKENLRHMLQGPGERLMGMDWEKRVVFPRLHLTGQLAKTLKEADPARTDLHEGMEATKQALLGLDLCQYSAIVFATHGYFNRDMPGIQEPLMVLTLLNLPNGQDGFLRASEVSALKLRADLVVLLACDSGLGNFAPRIGTNSIANSFLWAGARSVIAKLWCGAEKPSVMLVESFFKHLREGKSKLQALRLARHETRKSGYDHPFFWAPFILVGEVE